MTFAKQLAAVLLLAWGAGVAALEADKDQPIYVEADGVEIDEQSGSSIYQGNVVLTQGSISISADQVVVTQASGNNQGQVVAEGNPVTFSQQGEAGKPSVKGRAKKVEYQTDSELLVMTGDAELAQDGDTFSSDRIEYDRAKSVVKAGASAQGKQRVRMTIQPPRP